jgi:hypothetical protein
MELLKVVIVKDVLEMINIHFMDILVLQEVLLIKMEEIKMELQRLELLIQQHVYSLIVRLVIIDRKLILMVY